MNIQAEYDQTITKAIRNDKGEIIAHSPTVHHFVFGSIGSEISGGFYLKVENELPQKIELTTKTQVIKVEIPALDIGISIKK